MRRRTKPGERGERVRRDDEAHATWSDYKDVLKAEQEAFAETDTADLHEETLPFTFMRPPQKTRRFVFALLFSLLLHLSAVTIFKVVIYFPRQDIVYFPFDIVPTESSSQVSLGLSHELTLGGMETLFNNDAPPDNGLRIRGTLPDIELPTMEFAEMDRLQMRQEGLRTRSLYDQIAAKEPKDSWGRFVQGVGSLGTSLKKLTLGRRDNDALRLNDGPVSQPYVFEPATGFQGFLVWEKGVGERALLFAPKLEVLMGVDPQSLDKPIEVVLQVNSLGRVVNVYSPTVSESELVDEVQFAILSRYRFAPQKVEGEDLQTATLIIRPRKNTL